MKAFILAGVVTMVVAGGAANTAEAAGCLSGAAVGGVAGHYAGHHGVLGAAAGCAVGHHQAVKQERARAQDQRSGASSDNGARN